MEEKVNNLVSFALKLIPETRDVYDYYMPLSYYCIHHPDEEITNDFNDVVGMSGGVKLIFIKLSEKLAEREYNKTKDSKYLKRMETFAGYFRDNLEKIVPANEVRKNK